MSVVNTLFGVLDLGVLNLGGLDLGVLDLGVLTIFHLLFFIFHLSLPAPHAAWLSIVSLARSGSRKSEMKKMTNKK
jgi:hypothetical protein